MSEQTQVTRSRNTEKTKKPKLMIWKANKIGKRQARLVKKKSEGTNNSRNFKGYITSQVAEIYGNKIYNLGEMDKFLEK